MKGWVKLHRKIQDNDFWTCEKFTRGQAWVDLILLCNHQDSFYYKRGVKIDVKRGQLGRSIVELSDRWSWSRNKVTKFLNDLEKEQQIKQQKTNITMIITVLNYDLYQNEEPKGQQIEQQKGSKRAAKGQQKDTYKNDNNSNNEYNDEEVIKPKPKKPKFSFKDELLNLGADEQHIDDWMQVRKNKKAANTKTALEAIIKEANENNYPIAKAVQICAEKGWQGFKFQWVQNLAVDDLQKENQILKAKQENKKLKNKEHHDQRQIDMAINLGFLDHADNQTEPATEDTDFTIL